MHDPFRRSVLKALLTLPFCGKLLSWASIDSKHLGLAPGVAPAKLALNVVRMFNTLEAWHNVKLKTYATKFELQDSGILQKLLEAPHANEAGLGSELYSQMAIESEEILPGWSLHLHVSDQGNAYLVS